jgi:hypothetical protein
LQVQVLLGAPFYSSKFEGIFFHYSKKTHQKEKIMLQEKEREREIIFERKGSTVNFGDKTFNIKNDVSILSMTNELHKINNGDDFNVEEGWVYNNGEKVRKSFSTIKNNCILAEEFRYWVPSIYDLKKFENRRFKVVNYFKNKYKMIWDNIFSELVKIGYASKISDDTQCLKIIHISSQNGRKYIVEKFITLDSPEECKRIEKRIKKEHPNFTIKESNPKFFMRYDKSYEKIQWCNMLIDSWNKIFIKSLKYNILNSSNQLLQNNNIHFPKKFNINLTINENLYFIKLYVSEENSYYDIEEIIYPEDDNIINIIL